MRILILLTDLFDKLGGIQTYNRCIVNALSNLAEKNNWHIYVFVLNDKGNSSLIPKYIKSKNIIYKGFKGNKILYTLTNIFFSMKSNVVFLGHVNFAPLVPFFLNNKSKKYLVVYGIDVWKKLPILSIEGISEIDKIISISDFTKNQMIKFNNIPEDKFTIFKNCSDPIFQDKNPTFHSKEDLNLPNNPVILSVSRLDDADKYKKIDLVIKSMPFILKEIPNATYVIVGDGNDRPRLEQITKNVGVNNNVIFTGEVPHDLLSSYYNACDVFVLPSLKEGFGIVFLEAMYYAKPCIGANAGGIPEVIEDGVTGFLWNTGYVYSLVDIIIRLLKNDNLKQSLGLAGKQRLRKMFTFELFQKELENVLCQ